MSDWSSCHHRLLSVNNTSINLPVMRSRMCVNAFVRLHFLQQSCVCKPNIFPGKPPAVRSREAQNSRWWVVFMMLQSAVLGGEDEVCLWCLSDDFGIKMLQWVKPWSDGQQLFCFLGGKEGRYDIVNMFRRDRDTSYKSWCFAVFSKALHKCSDWATKFISQHFGPNT